MFTLFVAHGDLGCFFFFKQKTAYEIPLRLVGSEMCIRDRDEIVPVTIPQKKGDPVVFDKDEFINRKTSAEGLAGLRPAFDKAGGVTAGNASGLNDGAAAVLVTVSYTHLRAHET